jgi:hypothetical protein
MDLAQMKAYTRIQTNACNDENTSVEDVYWKCHKMCEQVHETLYGQLLVGEDHLPGK